MYQNIGSYPVSPLVEEWARWIGVSFHAKVLLVDTLVVQQDEFLRTHLCRDAQIANGFHINGVIVVRKDLTHELHVLKTMFHELGHLLVKRGLIDSLKNVWWVKAYCNVRDRKRWIRMGYSHLRGPAFAEEMVVECLALWALDSALTTDLSSGEVNGAFVSWLQAKAQEYVDRLEE